SGLRLLFQKGARVDPDKNPVLRVCRSMVPVTEDYVDGKFFVRREKFYATPLLLVLLVIETTDVIFAVDSIPAVLSITLNTFIVYTSNIFAILGLRSLFFALSSLMDVFEYLHYGISGVLVFVGFKMLLSHYYAIRTDAYLALIGSLPLLTRHLWCKFLQFSNCLLQPAAGPHNSHLRPHQPLKFADGCLNWYPHRSIRVCRRRKSGSLTGGRLQLVTHFLSGAGSEDQA